MELVTTQIESIDDDKLIDFLHSVFSTESIDEVLETLSDDDAVLMNWLHTQIDFEDLDEYSYEELIDFIEDNF